jgi:hypothetical protein
MVNLRLQYEWLETRKAKVLIFESFPIGNLSKSNINRINKCQRLVYLFDHVNQTD